MNYSLLGDRLLLIVLAFSGAMLCLIIVKPLGFDNALMQSMALDVFRYHRAPYTGIWIHDFPGIIYFHVLAMWLFGSSDLSIRLFDCIIQLLFAGFLYRFLLRWLSPNLAALAAVLYVAYYVSAGSLLLSERDVYGAMTIFLSVYCLIRARQSQSTQDVWIITAGLIAGLHLILRPMALLYMAILAGSVMLSNDGTFRWKAFFRALELLVAGLLPLALMLYYFSRTSGALDELYRQVVLWNADLYAPLSNGLLALVEELGRRALLLPFAIYGLIQLTKTKTIALPRPLEGWEKMIYWSLIGSSLAIALLMQKYFSYHFAPFFMLTIPLSAIGIATFARKRPAQRRHLVFVISVMLCTFITYYPKSPVAFGYAILKGENPWNYTYDVQFPDPSWGGAAERATVEYLQKPENRAGLAEICSFKPQLHLHCGHPSATRYEVLDALAMRTDYRDDGEPHYTAYQKLWQTAYLDSLRSKRPRFIILARNASFMYLQDAYSSFLHDLPGFDRLLADSYRYDTALGGYQIFRIRSDSSGSRNGMERSR